MKELRIWKNTWNRASCTDVVPGSWFAVWPWGRANPRGFWSGSSGRGWIRSQTRDQLLQTSVSSPGFGSPRPLWCWALDISLMLLYSVSIPTYQTCPVFSISLLSPWTGGSHLFPLFSGTYLWELCWLPRRWESWRVEETKVSVTVWRVLCRINFLCEQNHEISLFMRDMAFKGCLTGGNIK